MDLTTSSQARGKLARLCVLVDLDKLLRANYRLKGRSRKIEYEGIHLISFHCGKYGHEKDACIQNVGPPPKSNQESQHAKESGKGMEVEGSLNQAHKGTESMVISQQLPGSEDIYGPWMIVTRNRRKRRVVPISNGAISEEKNDQVKQVPHEVSKDNQGKDSDIHRHMQSNESPRDKSPKEGISGLKEVKQANKDPHPESIKTNNLGPVPKEFLIGSQMRKEKARLAHTKAAAQASQNLGSEKVQAVQNVNNR